MSAFICSFDKNKGPFPEKSSFWTIGSPVQILILNKKISSLEVDADDMEGLPVDYKEAHQQAGGIYKIDLSYPSYGPFMKYSKSESARKALFMKYQNRACLLYTSPSPRDKRQSRMPSSA